MRDAVEAFAGGEALMSGAAVLWFAELGARAKYEQRRNGVPRNPVTDGWVDTMAVAATRTRASAIGSRKLPIATLPASLCHIDPVATKEAAQMLGTTARNVVDLIDRGAFPSARKVAGCWQIERAEVLARVERMAR